MSLQGNWVDLIIIIVLVYFLSEAFRVGFWILLADFTSFFLALIFALFGYRFIASFFRSSFSLPHSFSNVLGFLTIAVIAGGLFGFLFSRILKKIPKKFWKKRIGYVLAMLPALGEGLVIIAFILTIIIGLPISSNIKTDISNSKIGGAIVKNTSSLNARIDDIFGQAVKDSLTYLTVAPGSTETVSLVVGEQKLLVDEVGERAMFDLVNEARANQKVPLFEWNEKLVNVARDYARNMWENKYFGHYSLEGENVGNRLDVVGIKYRFAGENLAMAPTVVIAQTGLMNSDGHRKNILDKNYGKIGIGVIDNGIYGKMFVQVFTN